jgi:hypothetical protein
MIRPPGSTSGLPRRARWGASAAAALLAISMFTAPLGAVRANWGVRQAGPRLEQMGRHEEAAFFYRCGLDFYAVIYQLWIDSAVYDERADEIYRRGAEAFGAENWRSQDHEERWDTVAAYLLFFNRDGVSRNVEKGGFTASQRARLADRVRIYMEDLLDPDHGFGGDFSFARKARVLEGVGLFWHASFRRELAGRYAIAVCSRYCAGLADEMERVFGDRARADLYRRKAAWWRDRGLTELHLCNGDRRLAELKRGSKLRRLSRQELLAVLRKGLASQDADARGAAESILADVGEIPARKSAIRHGEVGSKTTRPGVLLEYFTRPGQRRPLAKAVFETVDLGMKFQANFPKPWYDCWRKPGIFPADATGPFRLRITGTLLVPSDGNYRFYAKTDPPNRAALFLTTSDGRKREVISPQNDKNLQSVSQVGMGTHRIDFSRPVRLARGQVDFTILYDGGEVRNLHHEHMVRISGVQKAGIQLFWSSEKHLTELVPARLLFHKTE